VDKPVGGVKVTNRGAQPCVSEAVWPCNRLKKLKLSAKERSRAILINWNFLSKLIFTASSL
jgi:hypothetical protein